LRKSDKTPGTEQPQGDELRSTASRATSELADFWALLALCQLNRLELSLSRITAQENRDQGTDEPGTPLVGAAPNRQVHRPVQRSAVPMAHGSSPQKSPTGLDITQGMKFAG